jgi:hypothetical protein
MSPAKGYSAVGGTEGEQGEGPRAWRQSWQWRGSRVTGKGGRLEHQALPAPNPDMQTHRAEEWEEGENTTETEIIGKTAK